MAVNANGANVHCPRDVCVCVSELHILVTSGRIGSRHWKVNWKDVAGWDEKRHP